MDYGNGIRLAAGFALAVWLGCGAAAGETSEVTCAAVDLLCEYQAAPLALGTPRPRFCWRLVDSRRGAKQTAWRIRVAESPEALPDGGPLVWDSGKVRSHRNTHVAYAGEPLVGHRRYWWKVRVWDAGGEESAWSDAASFDTAFLPGDDWVGQWVGADWDPDEQDPPGDEPFLGEWIFPHNRIDRHEFWIRSTAYHYFRQGFDCDAQVEAGDLWVRTDKPVKVWLNGQVVLDRLDEIPEAMTMGVPEELARTRWPTYHAAIGGHLRRGTNVIAVQLFRPAQTPLGAMRLGLRIKTLSGTVTIGSDPSWRAVSGEDAEHGRYVGPGGWHLKQLPANWNSGAFDPPTPKMEISDDGLWARPQRGAWFPAQSTGSVHPMRNRRSVLLRKGFRLEGRIARARLYATALGAHELWVNGRRANDEFLSPGKGAWDGPMGRNLDVVERLLQYHVYDVTDLLEPGPNALGAVLGNGWYNGMNVNCSYRRPALRAELHVDFADGRTRRIASDASWRFTTSPVLWDNIHFGERYDARLEPGGWSESSFDDATWSRSAVLGAEYEYWNARSKSPTLIAPVVEPIRAVERIAPVTIARDEQGRAVIDFGQLISGVVRVKIRGAEPGRKLTMHYGYSSEAFNRRFANLHEDTYICRGDAEEVWQKKFGWGTIRYARLSNYPGEVKPEDIRLLVLHNDWSRVGEFACSSGLANRLWEASVNTFRGNTHYHTYDTERERMNWGPAAMHPLRMASWAYRLIGHQRYQVLFQDRGEWAVPHAEDVIIAMPWTGYLFYGDKRFVAESYPKMQSLVDWRLDRPDAATLWWRGLGNWKAIDAVSPEEMFGQTWHYISVRRLGLLAGGIDRNEDAQRYLRWLEPIAEAFNEHLLDREGGTYAGDAQAGLAMAVYLQIVPEDIRGRIFERLGYTVAQCDEHLKTKYKTDPEPYNWLGREMRKPWRKNPEQYEKLRDKCQRTGGRSLDYHLTIGPFGCPFLFQALRRAGLQEVAWRALMRESYPSLGYMMRTGNRAIPESYDGGNSHPAYTAFADWLFESVTGLQPDIAHPGFKHFFVRPEPAGSLTWGRGRYESLHGPIESDWRIADGAFTLDVAVPPNTSATVILPAGAKGPVTESGLPVGEAPGIRTQDGMDRRFLLEAGRYSFSSPWDGAAQKRAGGGEWLEKAPSTAQQSGDTQ